MNNSCHPLESLIEVLFICWIENATIAKRAQSIWQKIVEVNFWKTLPKSKQPGKGKPAQNISYDCLAKSVDDPAIHLKLPFLKKSLR